MAEEIKLCGVSIGEVVDVVEVEGAIVMSKNFCISTIGDIKLIHYVTPTLRHGYWENSIITIAGDTDCRFSEIESKTHDGGIPNLPTIIQIGKFSYLKFEIYDRGVSVSTSKNLKQWVPIGMMLKKKEVGSLSVIREDDTIKMWFSHYDNHEELNYEEEWLITHASLNIKKIEEVIWQD